MGDAKFAASVLNLVNPSLPEPPILISKIGNKIIFVLQYNYLQCTLFIVCDVCTGVWCILFNTMVRKKRER
jgi:hypothetical protein